MGFYNSPRIILDDLVLNLDAGNIKSYAGDTLSTVGTDYGYWAGGEGPSPGSNSSTVDRVDFSNDTPTASARGPLAAAIANTAGTGSLSYGYIGSGGTYPPPTTVQRIDYSSDSSTAAPKGPLTSGRYRHAATGNNSYGYFGGGTAPEMSSVDRIDYSNDTATAAPKGPLSDARQQLSATGNQSYGYFSGGGTSPYVSTVDRIDYSNDTATAVAKGPLNGTRRGTGSTGNASYGWVAGGRIFPSPSRLTTVDRIDYSNDTATAASKGPLAVARQFLSATGTQSYGYFGGGNNASDAYDSSVDRIDYSNDTATAAAKGPLSAAKYQMASMSPRANAIPTTSSSTRSATQTVGTPYGYFGGGEVSSYLTTIERLDYSSDTTTAAVKGPLSVAKRSLAATGSTSYGYWAGGYIPARSSTVDRSDYSNDTATTAPKGNLSIGHVEFTATGNNNYGYFGSGEGAPGAYITTVDRIDYSNDTTTASAKSPLTVARDKFGATGNTNYGYFAGGYAFPSKYSTIDRIDYSNDTPTASPKGPLSAATYKMAATGNADYGYWGAGRIPGSPSHTTITQRLDYSSDTTTAAAKGPLAYCQSYMGSTGNTSYGYWGSGSGQPGSNVSTADRLDYSNDTAAASAKGPLNLTRIALAAASPRANALPGPATLYPWYDTSGKGDDGNNTSGGASFSSAGGGSFTFNGSSNYVSSDDKVNLQLGSGNFTLAAWIKPANIAGGTNYGYFAGGSITIPGSNNQTSIVQRIDYADDTATALSKGPLSANRSFGGAASSISYGYLMGGFYGDPVTTTTSHVDRLDYSSDTTTAAAKGPLNTAVQRNSGIGNNDYGYSLGGNTPEVTTVDRIDYSNDTATASPKGPLSLAKRTAGSTGNQSYGYFGGGYFGMSAATSLVDRIDYSSDTSTAAAKGPLSAARYAMGAAGTASYGWWAGGGNPAKTTTDRLDYSSDTTTAAPKGPLSRTGRFHGATGSASYGYWAGGVPTSTRITNVDRIDYSNDTPTASAKGPLNTAVSDIHSSGYSSKQNGAPLLNDNEGIISYSDSSGEENDTTCQFDVNSDGKIRFTGAAGIVTSTSATTADTWVHSAITRSDNTISVYINGVLENTGITTHTFSDYATVTIGANRPRSTFFKGDISQVQIYKKSLSSDQIQQNFRSVKKRFGL